MQPGAWGVQRAGGMQVSHHRHFFFFFPDLFVPLRDTGGRTEVVDNIPSSLNHDPPPPKPSAPRHCSASCSKAGLHTHTHTDREACYFLLYVSERHRAPPLCLQPTSPLPIPGLVMAATCLFGSVDSTQWAANNRQAERKRGVTSSKRLWLLYRKDPIRDSHLWISDLLAAQARFMTAYFFSKLIFKLIE